MIRDLRTLLEGWEYEPGRISVRKILGGDGREKIQTRVDLGVLQVEARGRPDGRRIQSFETLLDLHDQRLARHKSQHASDEDFVLSPDECRELRHEAYLYHQRFVSYFVLGEFDGVIRDTEHCQRVIDFCRRFAEEPRDRDALNEYRNYVYMMNVRARALLAAERGEFATAMQVADEGIAELSGSGEVEDEAASESWPHGEAVGELQMLHLLKRELIERMPDDAIPRLEAALAEALRAEDYEEAARVRNQLARARSAG